MAIAAKRQDEGDDLSDDVGMPESEPIVLTARDWEAFLAEWDDLDRPRPRLEEAARRYLSRLHPDVG